ncbi:2-oxoglutarate and iron-dependent oxygenase domain-containing protein [Streptomyces sp. Ag109_O5-10]|uniref:2-oxoglutarate and iron-dependent oxygenase domain-containing protein n=1 Tax=Streptomyces sp. Ag109_O5-10 TaxID=1855349 RepID=UPI0035246D37
MRQAAQTIGIIQIVNHGVPAEVITEFNDGFRRVLDLPARRRNSWPVPPDTPTAAGGSGPTTSAASNSNGSTSASTTTRKRPRPPGSPPRRPPSTPTPTCGRRRSPACAPRPGATRTRS